jgi:hypothetical protein
MLQPIRLTSIYGLSDLDLDLDLLLLMLLVLVTILVFMILILIMTMIAGRPADRPTGQPADRPTAGRRYAAGSIQWPRHLQLGRMFPRWERNCLVRQYASQ